YLTAPFAVADFDPAVAEANGYEVHEASDGTLYPVEAGSSVPLVPDNEVPGNCGTSHVYVTPIGGRQAVIQTGWVSTLGPAVDYSWAVTVADDYGVSVKTWGGSLWFRTSWVGTNLFTSSGTGWVFAEVTGG